jgi:hypothetical protein
VLSLISVEVFAFLDDIGARFYDVCDDADAASAL